MRNVSSRFLISCIPTRSTDHPLASTTSKYRAFSNTPYVHACTYVRISMINRVKRPRSLQSVPPAATRNPCITAGTRRRRRTSSCSNVHLVSVDTPTLSASNADLARRKLWYETIVCRCKRISSFTSALLHLTNDCERG